jgi:hypothetical protein
MILDSYLKFSSAQDLFTPAAGAIDSTNIIDLGIVNGLPNSANGGGARDIGTGDNPAMELFISVSQVFAGGTSLAVALQGAPDNGSGAPGSYTTMWVSPTIVTADLDAGQQIGNVTVPRPAPGQALPRFLKLVYTTVGDFTTGTVDAYIVLDRDDQVLGTNGQYSGYPAGLTVAN